MNKEQMRIAIAEACGRCTSRTYTMTDGWETAVCNGCGKNPYHADHELPCYPNDLNAMAEAVRTLDVNQLSQWLDELDRVCVPVHVCPTTHADAVINSTAEQRAEAFLKTIDKWVE